ncbi:uncharacterized protein PFL1_02599 [Pseudozyma flocculosa PF-1]|uniref:Related to TGL2 - triacylglycerol lipase n=2 Tax=Pseudozyma flocculosa TaxID=84751 RepID=A0A5C3EZL4_9BASI|nr:uncharacterized protein PFL1_02599 [Pseudozyma flocculosa PF-1]EPQ29927.1 hypothetical protein PFL1_02599 [Pseudozyma flocculosa PF-1]SPO37235.1 related to TGL2 - triacylglycerol lipase [Pseudozyma flocculosa]
MRASALLRIQRGLLRHHRPTQDPTIASLLRERLQTSFDGVVRGLPSTQPSSPFTLRHSRNGLVALIGWFALVSYLEGPASQSHPSAVSNATTTLQPIIATSGSHVRPFPARSQPGLACTRRLHTSSLTRQQSARRLRDSVLSDSRSQPSDGHAGHTADKLRHKARYGSLAHAPASHGSWFERFGLAFLRASSSNTSRDSGRSSSSSKVSSSGNGGKADKSTQGTGRIYDHIRHPSLYDPIVAPRHPIVLCHGLYGFDVRGPFFGLEIHYWANVLDILRKKVGADVLIHGVPPTGSIKERAEALHRFLCSEEAGVRGKKLNFIGHSMGGLDVRHLITNIRPKPEEYTPISLTTVSTPHRGSPFMDWCNANIGIGNDYIERALEEARANRAGSTLHSGSHEPVRPPYSLKTPLFSRPKNGKRVPDGAERQATKSSARESIASGSNGPAVAVSGAEAAGVAATSAVLEAVDRAADAVGISRQKDDDGAHQRVRESEDRVATSVKESVKSSKSGSLLPFGLSSFAKALSSLSGSFSAYMLSLLDTPAYAMLSTKYMAEVFNPNTPNSPDVKYYSVAARTPSLAIWHPLWLPKLILDAAAESRTVGGESDGSADALGSQNQGNDGLVSVESAKWGEFLGIMEGCDHWDLRGGGAPRWKGKVNPATGKPYQSKAEMTGQPEVTATSPDRKPTESSTSWTDINQLLFSSDGDKDKAVDADTRVESDAASSSAPANKFPRGYAAISGEVGWSGVRLQDAELEDLPGRTGEDDDAEAGVGSSFTPQNDDTLVNDIAAWISDRLPERNVERRAQAAERDRLISEMSLTLYQPDTAGLTDTRGVSSHASTAPDWTGSDIAGIASSAPSALPASTATAAGMATSALAPPTNRPQKAQTQESARGPEGSSDKAKTREDAPSSTTPSKAQTKSPPQPDELERFWVALCRHLHVEGF